MTRSISLLAAAVLVAASAAQAHEPARTPAPAGRVSPSARAAQQALKGFHVALAAGETQKALDYLAPDVLIVEEGGAERSRAEYASHHLAADAAFTRAVPGTPLSSTGDAIGDLAYIVTETRMTGVYDSKPVDRLSAESAVLRNGPAGWKIIHIHWSSRAARPK
jgi:ketosteroid isomerase-like protein